MSPESAKSASHPDVEWHTLRDPAGGIFESEGKVLRAIYADFAAAFLDIMRSPTVQRLISEGKLIPAHSVVDEDAASYKHALSKGMTTSDKAIAHIVSHPRIPFVSYPEEWSSGMLSAAAALTLDISQELMPESLGLKDATPRNVLFRGTTPIFIDILSIEARNPLDSSWMPFAQFTRSFLHPLLVQKLFALPPKAIYATHHDGLSTEAVYRMCGWLERFRPKVFSTISVPYWLGKLLKGGGSYKPLLCNDAGKARFILRALYRTLRRQLESVLPTPRKSTWSDYAEALPSYTDAGHVEKRDYVQQTLNRIRPKRVLDVGSNTGEYSFLAAEAGASVIAIDSDDSAVDRLYRRASEKKLDILPLIVDLANPTSGSGWRNRETVPFLNRAAGHADCVLMLAVMHHLTISNGIPIEEVVSMASHLTSDKILFEYVGPKDPMCVKLAKGRVLPSYTREYFEALCQKHFVISAVQPLSGGHRILYVLEKRK